MLVEKSWDAMTDEEMLIEMDDFGDDHTTIHEAARRIRAKNKQIAALEAEAVALRDVVQNVEWVDGKAGYQVCPWCHDEEPDGHDEGCKRVSVLRHTATTPDKESEAVDAESLAHYAAEAEAVAREVSESEIAAYTLQAFGERYHLINRHREDLNTCSYPTCVNLAESISALRRTATTSDKEPKTDANSY